jgi:endonuclease YncB( thermonuclease family)
MRPVFRLSCRRRVACALIALAGLWLAGTAAVAQEQPPCAALEIGLTRTVTRVIDGETVLLDDGSELRLIGALAPRAIDAGAAPGTWPLETAAQEALRALVLGKSIALAFAGARTDRYGRLQAHAFLIEGQDRRWVQGHMLGLGLARAYGTSGDRACASDLLAAELPAREARRGLWSDAAYQKLAADRPAELLRHRATFQVIEGRVVRVAQVRGTFYLNFARNWRQGFSASLRQDDLKALLGAHAANPKVIEGKNVLVRGWIEQRGAAPVVDLALAGLIEVINDGAGQGR